MNTVGTFGIASASYYWSRVAGAIGRLLQYLSGHSSTSWHMLVADEYLLESGGPGCRSGRPLFFALCISWHKTCGGDTLVWVGFEILFNSRSFFEFFQYAFRAVRVSSIFVLVPSTSTTESNRRVSEGEGGEGQVSEFGGCLTWNSAQRKARWQSFCAGVIRRNTWTLRQHQNKTQGPREGAGSS